MLALGPALGVVWEGGELALGASLSLSLSLNGERLGGKVSLPAS